MTTKQLTQQNFQGEVISGYVMHLIKLTLENIRLGKQPINNKGENHDNIRQSENIISKK